MAVYNPRTKKSSRTRKDSSTTEENLSQQIIDISIINMENAERELGRAASGSTQELQAGWLFALNAQNVLLTQLIEQQARQTQETARQAQETARLADAVYANTEMQREILQERGK